jgi:hypothetical protein
MAKRAYRVVGTKGEFESIPNLENELYEIDEAFTSLKKAKAYADKMTVYFNKTYNLNKTSYDYFGSLTDYADDGYSYDDEIGFYWED